MRVNPRTIFATEQFKCGNLFVGRFYEMRASEYYDTAEIGCEFFGYNIVPVDYAQRAF